MARRRTPHMASADEKTLSEAELRGMEASALVEAAKSGDPNAFDALVRRYRSRIFALALHLTGSRSEAVQVWPVEQILDTTGGLGASLRRKY